MEKNVVITGGTKGIGRALVEAFANEGHQIITCSRHQQDLDQLHKEINQKYRVKCHVFQADLSKFDQVTDFASEVLNTFSGIDVLINNVGYFAPGEIENESDGSLEQMMDANVFSAYNLTRKLLPAVLKNKGYIFNMCSIASIVAYPGGGNYCITKFALLGFSKVLREEMKTKGVKVTSVLPGAVYTSSWEDVDLPEERFIKPEDVAESVLSAYKLSDRSVVEELVIRPQLGDI